MLVKPIRLLDIHLQNKPKKIGYDNIMLAEKQNREIYKEVIK